MRQLDTKKVNKYIKWLSWIWIKTLSERFNPRKTMYGLVGALIQLIRKNENTKLTKTMMTFFYYYVRTNPKKYHS